MGQSQSDDFFAQNSEFLNGYYDKTVATATPASSVSVDFKSQYEQLDASSKQRLQLIAARREQPVDNLLRDTECAPLLQRTFAHASGSKSLAALPQGLTEMDKGGEGDCMFLSVAAAIGIACKDVRSIASEGLDKFAFSPEVLLGLLTDGDQQELINYVTSKGLSNPSFKDCLNHLKELLKQPGKLWGDQLYLAAFLNAYKGKYALNALVIDRLVPAADGKLAQPICIPNVTRSTADKAWIVLVRTRSGDGPRAAQHYRLGVLSNATPIVSDTFMYSYESLRATFGTFEPGYVAIMDTVVDCKP